jgi:hypothetical protein
MGTSRISGSGGEVTGWGGGGRGRSLFDRSGSGETGSGDVGLVDGDACSDRAAKTVSMGRCLLRFT